MAVSTPRKPGAPATEKHKELVEAEQAAAEVAAAGQVEAERVTAGQVASEQAEAGIRISDAAKRAGVSARTLRYYEELGLLAPSLYTPGGERRYTLDDVEQLERILELREVLGMNLDEIREFLALETRLDELRAAYRATRGATSKKALAAQKATLQEALELNESLAKQLADKLARMDAFRAKLAGDARRCRELLAELD
jgi:DNA-binding transcriptional MerR regulator